MLRTRKWEHCEDLYKFLIKSAAVVLSGDPVVVWDKALVLVRVLMSWWVFPMSLTRA